MSRWHGERKKAENGKRKRRGPIKNDLMHCSSLFSVRNRI
ncbi:Protein CBG26852 [Caenorhabditis briggsae]|uniref:Protein CBG26852 n=1 Tax=Caenorhabditis briggsae TaxID=6238 RepID=B6IM03_CAEBR|nr:Protein CBG26852 [Caenorhabditis briggsae]CAS00933.1 Protein CBG26852 [Caenorhabditis briggsae]